MKSDYEFGLTFFQHLGVPYWTSSVAINFPLRWETSGVDAISLGPTVSHLVSTKSMTIDENVDVVFNLVKDKVD